MHGTLEKENEVKRAVFVKLSEVMFIVRDNICRGRIYMVFGGKGGTSANTRPVRTLETFAKYNCPGTTSMK